MLDVKSAAHVVEYAAIIIGLWLRRDLVWKHSPHGRALGSITLLLTRKHIHSAEK